MRLLAFLLLAVALAACERDGQRAGPVRTPAEPPAFQLVAAVDEAAGKFVQVTVSRAELPFTVKSATLLLPGRPPLAASDVRSDRALGDGSVGRPSFGVGIEGGSNSRLSTGIGIGIPLYRQGTIERAVALFTIADPALYKRLFANAIIVLVLADRDGREHRLEAAAPAPPGR